MASVLSGSDSSLDGEVEINQIIPSVAASEYDHRLVAPLEDVRVPKGVITTFGQMEWS